MPRQESEEEDDAPPLPALTTPTKASRNNGACHACSDAEGIEVESDAYVEKQFDESTGKKRKYNAYLFKQWKTCPYSYLEPVQINH